jgi:autotransporter-associated beta strand protein
MNKKIKSSRTLLAASCIILASSAIIARADYVSVSNQAVTFALTRTSHIGGILEPVPGSTRGKPVFQSVVKNYDKSNNLVRQVTTQAAKAVTEKIGNLQVLEAIKDDFLDGTTLGWSIEVRDNQDGTQVILAKKQNKEDVDLSEIMPFSLPPVGSYNETETYQATYAANGSVISQATNYSGSGAFRGPFSLKINGDQIFASGVMPYKIMTYFENPSDKNTPTIVPILGAVNLYNFIGLGFNKDNQTPIVYGGSISLTAAKGTLVRSEPSTQSTGTGGSISLPGTVTLAGNNTYTVTTRTCGGTLTIGNNIYTDWTTINNNYAGGTTLSPGTLTLSGNNNYAGGSTISGGTLTTNSPSSTALSGVISGNGGLMKNGAGTLTFNVNNTYTGATTVNAGTLALGTTISSGTLIIGNNTYTAGMTVPALGR